MDHNMEYYMDSIILVKFSSESSTSWDSVRPRVLTILVFESFSLTDAAVFIPCDLSFYLQPSQCISRADGLPLST